MILEWKPQRLLTLPAVGPMGNSFLFTPGINEMPDDVWEDKVVQATLKSYLDRKDIVVRNTAINGGPGKPAKKVTTLKDLPVNMAVQAAKECINAKTLQAWQKIEARDIVLKAIYKQLEEIGAPESADDSMALPDEGSEE